MIVGDDDEPALGDGAPAPHRELEPHQVLACAVLSQAVEDARAGHVGAAAWLVSGCNGDRDFWARAAGVDPAALREAVEAWARTAKGR